MFNCSCALWQKFTAGKSLASSPSQPDGIRRITELFSGKVGDRGSSHTNTTYYILRNSNVSILFCFLETIAPKKLVCIVHACNSSAVVENRFITKYEIKVQYVFQEFKIIPTGTNTKCSDFRTWGIFFEKTRRTTSSTRLPQRTSCVLIKELSLVSVKG